MVSYWKNYIFTYIALLGEHISQLDSIENITSEKKNYFMEMMESEKEQTSEFEDILYKCFIFINDLKDIEMSFSKYLLEIDSKIMVNREILMKDDLKTRILNKVDKPNNKKQTSQKIINKLAMKCNELN